MAKIKGHPKLDVSVTLTMNEAEARAFDAIVGYGPGEFLQVFYKAIGTAYLKPHEEGLISLFQSGRSEVAKILHRVDEAKKVFDGTHIAAVKQDSTPDAVEEQEPSNA